MFSNRVCVSTNFSLLLSHLQSEGSVTSDPIVANGVSWHCLFEWGDNFLYARLGLRQPSTQSLIACVGQVSVVIQNSSFRCRRSLNNYLTCTDEQHSTWRFLYFSHAEIELLLDNGKLNITIDFEGYKSVNIRNLSLTGAFSVPAPQNCMSLAGQKGSTIYVLVKSRELSAEVQEWCICSFDIFTPDRVFTLARVPVRSTVVDGWLREEANQMGVIQLNNEKTQIRIDVLSLDDCHLENRIYDIPMTDWDLVVNWDTGPRPQGWICWGCGIRDDNANSQKVHFKFWLLADDGQLQLLTHLAQTTPSITPNAATFNNNHFYCLVLSPERHFVFVSSWEAPDVWQPYELAPSPNFIPLALIYTLERLFMFATIQNSMAQQEESKYDVLFEMKFQGIDCVIEPAFALAKGMPYWWYIQRDLFVYFEDKQNLISLIHLQPPTLKTEAMLNVQRLCDVSEGQDSFRTTTWKEWRDKVEHLLGDSKAHFL